MTYAVFLLVFLVPPIVVLAWLQRAPLAGVGGTRARVALPLTCLIAFVYTTPWDNYLVYRGVWGYGPGRVLGTIGYVPVEEYLFFLLQPILTGLFLYLISSRVARRVVVGSSRWFFAVLFFFISITVYGAVCLLYGAADALYLGLILAWAGPVLAGMWLYAGRYLLQWRRPAMLAVAIPTVYLWIADRIAIANGVWYIDERYSLPFKPFGLPIEEAVFFLVTNLLVVIGVLLFLHGDRIAASRAVRASSSISR